MTLCNSGGYDLESVAPAGRAVFTNRLRCLPEIAPGNHIGDTAVFILGGSDLTQPPGIYRRTIHQIQRSLRKNLGVTGKAKLFPVGTVSRNVHKIALHTPKSIAKQLIHIFISATEETGLLHIGIYRHCRKFLTGHR